MKGESYNQADVAASFQKAVVDVLVSHSLHAVKAYGLNKFAIAGGVASNSSLRAAFEEECGKRNIDILSSFSDLLHRQCSDDRCGGLL